MLTYGSLFTGAGGLEMGVQSVLPGRTLLGRVPVMTRCRACKRRLPYHSEHCPAARLAALHPPTEDTPEGPPQTETLWPEHTDPQGDSK